MNEFRFVSHTDTTFYGVRILFSFTSFLHSYPVNQANVIFITSKLFLPLHKETTVFKQDPIRCSKSQCHKYLFRISFKRPEIYLSAKIDCIICKAINIAKPFSSSSYFCVRKQTDLLSYVHIAPSTSRLVLIKQVNIVIVREATRQMNFVRNKTDQNGWTLFIIVKSLS